MDDYVGLIVFRGKRAMSRSADDLAPIAASARAVFPNVPEQPMARVSFYLYNRMR